MYEDVSKLLDNNHSVCLCLYFILYCPGDRCFDMCVPFLITLL